MEKDLIVNFLRELADRIDGGAQLDASTVQVSHVGEKDFITITLELGTTEPKKSNTSPFSTTLGREL